MSLNFEKQTIATGENLVLKLTKDEPLTNIRVGLGWDIKSGSGPHFDLDAVVALLGSDGIYHLTQ